MTTYDDMMFNRHMPHTNTTTNTTEDTYDWDADPEDRQAEQLEGIFEATSPLEARRNTRLVRESEVAERADFAADLPHWLD